MKIIAILEDFNKTLSENKALLNDLDQAIGDGDHGTNMARGFEMILRKKETFQGKDLPQIINECAMILISQIGGSSGPLIGTAFMKTAAALKGKTSFTREDFSLAFHSAIEGIQMRGKAVRGEKTMLDTLIPALESYDVHIHEDHKTLAASVNDAAQKGLDYTETIIATKGRASYLKERSLGHKDPGAYSSYLLIKVLTEHLL